MPLKYIIIICGAAIFFLLFLLYIILAVRRRKRNALRMLEMEKMYSDKNLATMEYDCAVYDEETEKLIAKQMQSGQITIDDVMASAVAAAADENVFQTVEKEGLEEITGNYKPE